MASTSKLSSRNHISSYALNATDDEWKGVAESAVQSNCISVYATCAASAVGATGAASPTAELRVYMHTETFSADADTLATLTPVYTGSLSAGDPLEAVLPVVASHYVVVGKNTSATHATAEAIVLTVQTILHKNVVMAPSGGHEDTYGTNLSQRVQVTNLVQTTTDQVVEQNASPDAVGKQISYATPAALTRGVGKTRMAIRTLHVVNTDLTAFVYVRIVPSSAKDTAPVLIVPVAPKSHQSIPYAGQGFKFGSTVTGVTVWATTSGPVATPADGWAANEPEAGSVFASIDLVEW